jgi:hypothetical protein
VPRFRLIAVVLMEAAVGLLVAFGSARADSTIPLSWGDAVRVSGEAWGCEEPSNLAGVTVVACSSRNQPLVRFLGPYISVLARHPPSVSRTPGPQPTYTYTFALDRPAQSPLLRYQGQVLTPGENLVFDGFPSLFCSFTYEPRAFTCFVRGPSPSCSLDDDPLTCSTSADAAISIVGAHTLQVSIDRPVRSDRADSGLTRYHWGPSLSRARAIRDRRLVGESLHGLMAARQDLRANTHRSLRRAQDDFRAATDKLSHAADDLYEASFAGPDPRIENADAAVADIAGRLHDDRSVVGVGHSLSRSERDRLMDALAAAIAITSQARSRLDEVVARAFA